MLKERSLELNNYRTRAPKLLRHSIQNASFTNYSGVIAAALRKTVSINL